MNKKLQRLHKGLNNNRGIGIVTVVIVVAFLIILGSLIMFTSYSGFREKTAARQGEELFYDAETALNQIYAGLQASEANAFEYAYTEVLTHYAADGEYSAENFQDAFMEKFSSGEDDIVTIGKEDEDSVYHFEALQDMVEAPDGVSVTVSSADADEEATTGQLDVDMTAVPAKITFKDVHVTVDQNNRTQSVTADIVMNFPSFDYILSQYSLSGVTTYGLVADTGIYFKDATSRNIVGNAYAGRVDMDCNSTLTVSGGTFISKGDISISGNGTFFSGENSELWAGGISVGTESAVKLTGVSYVADDLALDGNGATATLKKEYYGFGSDLDDGLKSSSIFANAKETRLDLSGLDYLTLAGCSFIDFRGENNQLSKAGVRMGESISAKGNERIYLAPVEAIRYRVGTTLASVSSNPLIATDVSNMKNATLRTDDELLSGARVETVAVPISGSSSQYIVYFFLEFDTPEDANAYFKNYFEKNPETVKNYLDSYIQVIAQASLENSRPDMSKTQTMGYTFSNPLNERTKETKLTLYDYVKNWNGLMADAKMPANSFSNLCRTLTQYAIYKSGSASSLYESPYEYLVNADKLDALSETKYFYDADGTTALAVVVNNAKGESGAKGPAFVYDGKDAQKDLCLIIASGDVEVRADFKGLILCGGTVSVYGNIKSDNQAVTYASLASNGSEIAADYMNVVLGQDNGNDESGDSSSFDLVVSIENLRKR